MGPGGGLRRDLPRRALRGPHPTRARLGRLDDLGRPCPRHALRGDGRSAGAHREGLVRHPSLVSAPPPRGAGGGAGGDACGLGRSRLPADVCGLLSRLAAGGLRRRAAARGARRGGVDGAGRGPPPLSRLRNFGGRRLRLQRPAARLLLRRRPRAPPDPPAAPLGGAGGGDPPGRRRPRQDGRRGARSGGARLRRARLAPAVAAAAGSAGAGGGAARPRPAPPRLLAGRRPRALRELRKDRLLVVPLAGDLHPRAANRRLGTRADGERRRMGDLLVDRAPGARRRLAGIAAAGHAPPAARRRRAPGGGVALLHHQPEPGVHRLDELEPLPGAGVGAGSPSVVPGSRESASRSCRNRTFSGTTCQTSVS